MVKIIMESTLSFSPLFCTGDKRRNKSYIYRGGKKKKVGAFRNIYFKKLENFLKLKNQVKKITHSEDWMTFPGAYIL